MITKERYKELMEEHTKKFDYPYPTKNWWAVEWYQLNGEFFVAGYWFRFCQADYWREKHAPNGRILFSLPMSD
jgi:hypothetical protein